MSTLDRIAELEHEVRKLRRELEDRPTVAGPMTLGERVARLEEWTADADKRAAAARAVLSAPLRAPTPAEEEEYDGRGAPPGKEWTEDAIAPLPVLDDWRSLPLPARACSAIDRADTVVRGFPMRNIAPVVGPEPGEASLATRLTEQLLPIVADLACREAARGLGANWLVWAQVWCGLALLGEAAQGFTSIETAQEFMLATLGLDHPNGGPDIKAMVERLYG